MLYLLSSLWWNFRPTFITCILRVAIMKQFIWMKMFSFCLAFILFRGQHEFEYASANNYAPLHHINPYQNIIVSCRKNAFLLSWVFILKQTK